MLDENGDSLERGEFRLVKRSITGTFSELSPTPRGCIRKSLFNEGDLILARKDNKQARILSADNFLEENRRLVLFNIPELQPEPLCGPQFISSGIINPTSISLSKVFLLNGSRFMEKILF